MAGIKLRPLPLLRKLSPPPCTLGRRAEGSNLDPEPPRLDPDPPGFGTPNKEAGFLKGWMEMVNVINECNKT